MVDRQKADTIAEKQERKGRRYSLSIENDGYDNNEISGTVPNKKDGLNNLEDD